jgi:hypothetical protein
MALAGALPTGSDERMKMSEERLRGIVELACRAPSIHNTQPWRWVRGGDTLCLYGDSRRRLVYADSTGRDLVISCGAALHHLVVASAAQGWLAHVERVPNVEQPELLASISFVPHAATADDVRMAAAIPRRRTDRRQVSSWDVPPSRLEQLANMAGEHGVLAGVVMQDDTIAGLLGTATREQNNNDAYLDELFAWTHAHANEGIPTANLLNRASAEKPQSAPSRFPIGSLVDDYEEDAPPSAHWLVLGTSSDDTLSWLRTGEALSAIWLEATVSGMALVPFTQAIEVRSTREELQAKLLGGQLCPQVLVRLGWHPVSQLPVSPTPRRDLDEVFEE